MLCCLSRLDIEVIDVMVRLANPPTVPQGAPRPDIVGDSQSWWLASYWQQRKENWASAKHGLEICQFTAHIEGIVPFCKWPRDMGIFHEQFDGGEVVAN